MQEMRVKVDGGTLIAIESQDKGYPGIDIEFVPDNDLGENASRPRIIFEKPKNGKLRALIWKDYNNEDYTAEIEFKEKTNGG